MKAGIVKLNNLNKPILCQIVILALVLNNIFCIISPIKPAEAALLNAGSSFMVCTGQAFQPFYTTQTNPSVTVNWTFISYATTTQKTYRVEIDDNANFGSVTVTSGTTTSAAAFYSYTSTALSFTTRYYWRLFISDSNNTLTDWIEGDTFITNKPSLKLQGGLKFQGGVKLK